MTQLRKTWIAPVLGLLLVLVSADAQASAWCNTRNNCRWWAKKYTANASVGCIGFSLPLCYSHSGHCDGTSVSCGWKNCLWGGATAWASNGPGGCSAGGNRTGQGIYGESKADATSEADASGSHSLQSRAEFDNAQRTVTIALDRGVMTSSPDSMESRIDVYVFREDVEEGKEVEDPVRTEENTLWRASIVLSNGVLKVNGFDPRLFNVSRDEKGNTTVQFAGVKSVVPMSISDEDFGNLVVQVMVDGNTVSKQ